MTTTPFVNDDAKQIAARKLEEDRMNRLATDVSISVDFFKEYFKEAKDGSTFTFAYEYDGRPFYYAAIMSNGYWFTTGARTGLNNGTTDDLIMWLVGFGMTNSEEFLTASLFFG